MPTATPAPGGVTVQKSTWHYDILGAIWVTGEVHNGLNHGIELVKVTAKFYSASNTLLATDYGYACLTAVPANSDSPYTVLLVGPPAGIDHVTVAVTHWYDPPLLFPPPVGLQPTVTNTYTDIIGYLHLVGTVKNNSSNTYDFVQPCTAFYNSAGDVVRTDFTYTSPSTLAPGQTGTFDSSVDADGVGIVSYRLWVDAGYQ